jgi:hypothetical protein
MVIRATTPSELKDVSHYIHDLWIDVDTLGQATNSGTVELELFDDGQLRQRRGILTVHQVESICATDTQGIAGYNIGQIEYIPEDRRLQFVMNIPCKCEFTVNTLDLVLNIDN